MDDTYARARELQDMREKIKAIEWPEEEPASVWPKDDPRWHPYLAGWRAGYHAREHDEVERRVL